MHRLPTHHSAMHLPRSYHPYIFPTTPTTICTTPPYSTAHQILPLTHTTIINHDTSSPSNNHPYFRLYKTYHPTLQPTQSFTGTLLPSKYTSLHHSPFTSTIEQSNSSQHHTATYTHNPHQPPYNSLNEVSTLYQTHPH